MGKVLVKEAIFSPVWQEELNGVCGGLLMTQDKANCNCPLRLVKSLNL